MAREQPSLEKSLTQRKRAAELESVHTGTRAAVFRVALLTKSASHRSTSSLRSRSFPATTLGCVTYHTFEEKVERNQVDR